MRKREHEFCHECGSDLGERPPDPPRCRKCRMPVKGHPGPWGLKRCKYQRSVYEKFLKLAIQGYGAEFDKMMMEDHPCTLAGFGGKR